MTQDDERGSLEQRLEAIHERIRSTMPTVHRVALALHDPADDSLRTFLHSTVEGANLSAYRYRLADSESLSLLARTRQPRLLTDIPDTMPPTSSHAEFVVSEGYRSSYTVPLADHDRFLGFLFFDSRDNDAFAPEVRRELDLYANLIVLSVLNELVTVRSLVGAIQVARRFTELRDIETGDHLERMSRFARLIATGVATSRGHNDEWVERVFLYAPLHDVGKIGIPDHILLKPGALTPDEWEVMRSHTTIGGRLVAAMTEQLHVTTPDEDEMMRRIVELHHETLDGGGYPYGLRGDEVPDEARIIAVADVFDALTTRRPYKEPWDDDRAAAKLRELAEVGKLDAECVELLLEADDEVAAIRAGFAEAPASAG